MLCILHIRIGWVREYWIVADCGDMNFSEMSDPMEWNGVILIGVVSIQAGLHRLLVYALQAAVQTHCFPQLASIQMEVVGLYVVCLQDHPGSLV